MPNGTTSNKYRFVTHRSGNPRHDYLALRPSVFSSPRRLLPPFSYPGRLRPVSISGFWKETQSGACDNGDARAAIFPPKPRSAVILSNRQARRATLRQKDVMDNRKYVWCNIKYLLTPICEYFPKVRTAQSNARRSPPAPSEVGNNGAISR